MPLVFLGSYLGVLLGKMLGEVPRLLIFASTIIWSIQTTAKKAISLIKKEREEEMKKKSAGLG